MQKEFISPGKAELAGEDAFRFRHLLIKDAAYRALPKETRAELHERLADWLEDVAGARLPELEEIVAHHLEAAFRYHEELGSAESATPLARRAAAHLSASGGRAKRRGDVRAATLLLRRAAELGDPSDPQRPWLLLDLAAAEASGEHETLVATWEEIDRSIAASPDGRWRTFAELRRLNSWAAEGDTELDWPSVVRSTTEDAIAALEPAHDHLGLALAHDLRAVAAWLDLDVPAAAASWAQAAQEAREGGDALLEADAISWLGASLVFGETPVEEAERRLRAMLDRVSGVIRAEGMVEGEISACLALLGDLTEARAAADSALGRWRDVGLRPPRPISAVNTPLGSSDVPGTARPSSWRGSMG